MKLWAFSIVLFLAVNSYSQGKISDYKNVCDSIVEKYFGKTFLKQTHCNSAWIHTNEIDLGYSNYEKAEIEPNKILTITFFYNCNLYTETSIYGFGFELSIDKNMKVNYDTTLFNEAPNCLLTNFGTCNFISPDYAMSLAVQDSIKYPNNIKAYLQKLPLIKDYCWIIVSDSKKIDGYWPLQFHYGHEIKIFNARTGKMIPW